MADVYQLTEEEEPTLTPAIWVGYSLMAIVVVLTVVFIVVTCYDVKDVTVGRTEGGKINGEFHRRAIVNYRTMADEEEESTLTPAIWVGIALMIIVVLLTVIFIIVTCYDMFKDAQRNNRSFWDHLFDTRPEKKRHYSHRPGHMGEGREKPPMPDGPNGRRRWEQVGQYIDRTTGVERKYAFMEGEKEPLDEELVRHERSQKYWDQVNRQLQDEDNRKKAAAYVDVEQTDRRSVASTTRGQMAREDERRKSVVDERRKSVMDERKKSVKDERGKSVMNERRKSVAEHVEDYGSRRAVEGEMSSRRDTGPTISQGDDPARNVPVEPSRNAAESQSRQRDDISHHSRGSEKRERAQVDNRSQRSGDDRSQRGADNRQVAMERSARGVDERGQPGHPQDRDRQSMRGERTPGHREERGAGQRESQRQREERSERHGSQRGPPQIPQGGQRSMRGHEQPMSGRAHPDRGQGRPPQEMGQRQHIPGPPPQMAQSQGRGHPPPPQMAQGQGRGHPPPPPQMAQGQGRSHPGRGQGQHIPGRGHPDDRSNRIKSKDPRAYYENGSQRWKEGGRAGGRPEDPRLTQMGTARSAPLASQPSRQDSYEWVDHLSYETLRKMSHVQHFVHRSGHGPTKEMRTHMRNRMHYLEENMARSFANGTHHTPGRKHGPEIPGTAELVLSPHTSKTRVDGAPWAEDLAAVYSDGFGGRERLIVTHQDDRLPGKRSSVPIHTPVGDAGKPTHRYGQSHHDQSYKQGYNSAIAAANPDNPESALCIYKPPSEPKIRVRARIGNKQYVIEKPLRSFLGQHGVDPGNIGPQFGRTPSGQMVPVRSDEDAKRDSQEALFKVSVQALPGHGGSATGSAGHEASGSVHDGSVHGGSVHGGSVHGGSVHGGSVHEGSAHGGSVHGGSVHEGSVHAGSDREKGGSATAIEQGEKTQSGQNPKSETFTSTYTMEKPYTTEVPSSVTPPTDTPPTVTPTKVEEPPSPVSDEPAQVPMQAAEYVDDTTLAEVTTLPFVTEPV